METKTKVYISYPDGCKEGVSARLKSVLESKGFVCISCEDILASTLANEYDILSYGIRRMLDCDLVYMAKGWQECSRCAAERSVAEIYGKSIKYEIVEMPDPFWR